MWRSEAVRVKRRAKVSAVRKMAEEMREDIRGENNIFKLAKTLY